MMITKRLSILIIAAAAVFVFLTVSVSYGYEITASGDCGWDMSWELDSDGVLTISGEGDMWDISDDATPWKYHRWDIIEVVIKNGVESIGQNAFNDCYNLQRITIPNSVSTIKTHAFYLCTALSSIEIPAGVSEIELLAFEECTSLAEIRVSQQNSVYKSVNGILFTKDGKKLIYCPLAKANIENFQVPDGVEILDDYAFYNNKSLKTISFPSTLTTILGNTFAWCTKLRSVTIPSSVTHIGYRAFSYCNMLKTVTIPASVQTMGAYAFASCDALESFIFLHGITEIADSVLYNDDALKEVYIPSTVTSIQTSAFSGCSGLTDVYFGGSEYDWGNISFGYFNWDYLQMAEIHYNCFKGEPNFILPSALQQINSGAFSGIINGVFRLPANVSSIADDAFDTSSILLVPSGSQTESSAQGLSVRVIGE